MSLIGLISGDAAGVGRSLLREEDGRPWDPFMLESSSWSEVGGVSALGGMMTELWRCSRETLCVVGRVFGEKVALNGEAGDGDVGGKGKSNPRRLATGLLSLR